jgi:hypothetical protein
MYRGKVSECADWLAISKGGFKQLQTLAFETCRAAMSIRRGPALWLVLSGGLLIVAIAVGTALVISEFREQALLNSERELENTVQLLTRHFDQQFEDCDIITSDLISKLQLSKIASPEAFKGKMSGLDAHLMLKSKTSPSSYIGDVNIFDSNGELINSSGSGFRSTRSRSIAASSQTSRKSTARRRSCSRW